MKDILIQFWLLVLIAFLFRYFKPIIKGFVGEKTLSALLSLLPKENYLILNNIMLKTDKGTTQIDHIVVSIFGLFVIETKNYEGWVLGKETDDYWIQNIYGKKNRFKNPIHQNYGHVCALRSLLSEYPDLKIIPIVAFSGNCDLKVKTTSIVTYFSRVNSIIKSEKNQILSFEQVKEISNKITNANIDSQENRKEHVSAIKDNIKQIDTAIQNNICPKCGGSLLERIGKYGTFIGCSNYPKCRFILK